MSAAPEQKPGDIQRCVLGGYLGIECKSVPELYDAGFSTYVAAWPLLGRYPGNEFQTGLFGTWMHPHYDGPTPNRKLYCDIEGGLGWWRDTQYATETPKFIMGGVSLNFRAWANGPGAGKGRDWDNPRGLYGVAQFSPHVLWPPDGLNLKQGTCGQFWGYGYVPLPLIKPTKTTAGKDVPTGENCWTLFLNTGNFKGPVAFFTPYFFSGVTVDEPELAGLFLDNRPVNPNRPHQMETQHIPCATAATDDGQVYARIGRTRFPRDAKGESPVMHGIRAYTRGALWDAVEAWLDGNGEPASGRFDPGWSTVHEIVRERRFSWSIFEPGTPKDERTPVDWKQFAYGGPLDHHTFGYRWEERFIEKTGTTGDRLITLPEYYRLQAGEGGESKWTAVEPHEVPPETGLAEVEFTSKDRPKMPPYTTPAGPNSCWKRPGPVAGPFKARLGDGSTVVYYWYRFADQPALLNADLSDRQREELQRRVETLHAHWTPDREYLPPPRFGELAKIDPALVVTPPKGMEAGFVPIVTWQGVED